MILSAVAVLVLGGAATVAVLLFTNSRDGNEPAAAAPTATSAAPAPGIDSPFHRPEAAGKQVVLEVFGTGTADLWYKESLIHQQSLTGVTLPWRHEFTSGLESMTVSVSVTDAEGKITCRIEADGQELKNQPGRLCIASLID